MKGPRVQPNYTNVSNPAAFGVQWTAGDSDSTYQLANPRGTTQLLFGTRLKDDNRWHTTTVVDPSRFGMTKALKSLQAFMAIVRRYVED